MVSRILCVYAYLLDQEYIRCVLPSFFTLRNTCNYQLPRIEKMLGRSNLCNDRSGLNFPVDTIISVSHAKYMIEQAYQHDPYARCFLQSCQRLRGDDQHPSEFSVTKQQTECDYSLRNKSEWLRFVAQLKDSQLITPSDMVCLSTTFPEFPVSLKEVSLPASYFLSFAEMFAVSRSHLVVISRLRLPRYCCEGRFRMYSCEFEFRVRFSSLSPSACGS